MAGSGKFITGIVAPEKKSDVAFILNTVARLWLAGVEIDWPGLYGNNGD